MNIGLAVLTVLTFIVIVLVAIFALAFGVIVIANTEREYRSEDEYLGE